VPACARWSAEAAERRRAARRERECTCCCVGRGGGAGAGQDCHQQGGTAGREQLLPRARQLLLHPQSAERKPPAPNPLRSAAHCTCQRAGSLAHLHGDHPLLAVGAVDAHAVLPAEAEAGERAGDLRNELRHLPERHPNKVPSPAVGLSVGRVDMSVSWSTSTMGRMRLCRAPVVSSKRPRSTHRDNPVAQALEALEARGAVVEEVIQSLHADRGVAIRAAAPPEDSRVSRVPGAGDRSYSRRERHLV
jgi:hypothetical protein